MSCFLVTPVIVIDRVFQWSLIQEIGSLSSGTLLDTSVVLGLTQLILARPLYDLIDC